MAWSPVRRTNAGRFEVDHPGDYATLNSYHPVDGTYECSACRYVTSVLWQPKEPGARDGFA